MKKELMKLFSIILICLCFTLGNKVVLAQTIDAYFVNANGVEFSKTQYENFIKIGLNYDQINSMSKETYDSYSDMDYVEEDKTEVKYFRDTTITNRGISETISEEITEDEYTNVNESEPGIMFYGTQTVETDYKKLVVTSYQISTSLPNKRAVTASLTWKKLPKIRSYDIFATRVVNGEIAKNSEVGAMISKETSLYNDCTQGPLKTYTDNYATGNSSWNVSTAGVGYKGVGFTGQLSSGKQVCTNDIGMYFSIVRELSSTLSFQSVAGATAYVSYQHASTSVNRNSVYKAYTFSSSGLGGVIYFSNASIRNSYDGMSGISLTL